MLPPFDKPDIVPDRWVIGLTLCDVTKPEGSYMTGFIFYTQNPITKHLFASSSSHSPLKPMIFITPSRVST